MNLHNICLLGLTFPLEAARFPNQQRPVWSPVAGQDGLETAWWTGESGSVEIHLVYLLGKLCQEMLLVAVSVKPFGFTFTGDLALAQRGP